MTTHLNKDCPAMNPGDEMVDLEALEVEDWIYDCQTCQYTEERTKWNWEGGYLNGVQHALYKLDEIQTAIQLGRSKLQVFRLLINDWGDPESVGRNPQHKPLLIMTSEEIADYSCPSCDMGTDYSRTEGNTDIWRCSICGHEIRIPF